jgi:glycosyltransferase involved in cell wall biosynthesis
MTTTVAREPTCPRVSIITVVRNAKDLLKTTISAVGCLDYPNLEHLIIDGASSDGTRELAFSAVNAVTRTISEPDSGIYDAMNKGIRLSTGEYLWFLNAGDTPAAPGVLHFLLSTTPLPDLVYGGTILVNWDRARLRNLNAPRRLTWQRMTHGMHVSHQSVIVRRTHTPIYDTRYRYIADQKWLIEALKSSRRVLRTEGALSEYLLGGVSQINYTALLAEKIRYSFTELGVLRAVPITIKDLARGTMFAARHFLIRYLPPYVARAWPVRGRN